MYTDLLEYRRSTKTAFRVKTRLNKIRKKIISQYKYTEVLEKKIKKNEKRYARRLKFFKKRYESGKRKPTKTSEEQKRRLNDFKNRIERDKRLVRVNTTITDRRKSAFKRRAKSAYKNHRVSVRKI